MCGIAGIVRRTGAPAPAAIARMADAIAHRGPDDEDRWGDALISFAHRRLAILDLSPAGRQPMASDDGRLQVILNGEIYNYLELRRELDDRPYRTGTDTEVLLRAYERWGPACLDRLNGMFAFAIWDHSAHRLFAARDRFGVKPFYYAEHDGALYFASEIKALHAAGVPRDFDDRTWADYLVSGLYEHSERTFFREVRSLPPGTSLTWDDGRIRFTTYYDLGTRVDEFAGERMSDAEVADRYVALLEDAVRLRFRSDVPVGLLLSGGLDSSALLATIRRLYGPDCSLKAFTYTCLEPEYDETPWVRMLLEGASHRSFVIPLTAGEVPALAREVYRAQDEPFGGFPTLALSKLFAAARAEGVTVLLDAQGLDEQWAGYEYYARALRGELPSGPSRGPVQASASSPLRPECLSSGMRELATGVEFPRPFQRAIVNARYHDIRYTKIPRALRFGDRVSMMHARELREPCLDYRLMELALAQPDRRLIRDGTHKVFLRELLQRQLPARVVNAPKRAVQTPQREWLAGPLAGWVEELIESPEFASTGWFDRSAVRREWTRYVAERPDNSFFVWQWVSAALASQLQREEPAPPPLAMAGARA